MIKDIKTLFEPTLHGIYNHKSIQSKQPWLVDEVDTEFQQRKQ